MINKTPRMMLVAAMCTVLSACSSGNGGSIAPITSIPQSDQVSATFTVAESSPSLSETVDIAPTDTPATLTGFALLQVYAAQTQAAGGILPTATPWNQALEPGEARSIALATDMAYVPEQENPITFEAQPVSLTFDEFYEAYDLRRGLILSDKLLALDGLRVTMEGYMAPPLKPELDFFVLTQVRLSFCPFCTTAADWPDDIALIYLMDDAITATLEPIRVVGRLEVGPSVDQETGMLSLVRIYVDQLEIIG